MKLYRDSVTQSRGRHFEAGELDSVRVGGLWLFDHLSAMRRDSVSVPRYFAGMTTRNRDSVAGEPIDDLQEDLRGLRTGPPRRGMTTLRGVVGPSVVRALMRLEAELLIADAGALAAGATLDRTDGQRRADAFMLLIERMQAIGPSEIGP